MAGLLGGVVGKAVVEMVGDTAQLKSDMTSAEKTVGQTTKRSAAHMQGFKVAAAAAGAVAVAAFARFAAASVKAASDAEQSQTKLQNALQNNAKAGSVTIDQYNEQAAALQDLTGVEDDAINEVQALLATFNMEGETIQQLIPLILDLSAAKGINLTTAARAVARSTTGTTGALTRMGVMVDADKAKTDAFSATLDALNGVQGAAAAKGKTLAGQQAIMAANFDDLQETVGGAVIPILSFLVRTLNSALDAFNALPGPIRNGLVVLGLLGVAALGVLTAMAAMSGALGVLNISLLASTAAEGQLTVAMLIRNAATRAGAAAHAAMTAVMSLSLPVILAVTAAVAAGIIIWKEYENTQRLLGESSNASIGLMDQWGIQLQKGMLTVDEFTAKTKNLIAADKTAGISTEDLASEQQHAAGIVQGYANDTLKLSEAHLEAADAARDQRRAELQLVGGFLGVQSAYYDTVDASKTLAGTERELNRLRANGKKNTQAYRDAVLENRDAQIDAVQSQADLRGAVIDYIDTQHDGTATQKQAVADIRAFARQAGLTKGQTQALIASVGNLTNKYDQLPSEKKTNVSVPGVSNAISLVDGLRAKLDAIPNTTTKELVTVYRQVGQATGIGAPGGTAQALGGIVGAAAGGVVTRPTLLVGEGTRRTFAGKGAEAVVPFDSRGIEILARALGMAMQKTGGGGQVTVPVHVHGNVIGVDDLARDIERAQRNRNALVGGRT